MDTENNNTKSPPTPLELTSVLDPQDAPVEEEKELQRLVSQDEEDDEGKKMNGIFGASMNMITSIVGSGIIGIPYAFKLSGAGFSVILMILSGVVTVYSLDLLTVCRQKTGAASYQGVVRSTFGRPGYVIVSINQFLLPFASMVGYCIVIGDTFTKVVTMGMADHVQNTVLADRNFVTFLFVLLVILPLSLCKNIAHLALWSTIHVLLDFYLVVFVFYEMSAMWNIVPKFAHSWKFFHIGAAQGLTIMASAYVCHHNCFLIYDALEGRSRTRFLKVSSFSAITGFFLMTSVGIGGFATFTLTTEGDLLENYCYHDMFANVTRILFCLSIALTFPIEAFVCREVIVNAFLDSYRQSLVVHILVTVMLVGLAYAFSTITDCLGILFKINGPLNSVPILYLWPALCVIKLRVEEGGGLFRQLFRPVHIPPALLVLLALVVIVTSVVLTVQDIVRGSHCSHGVEKPYCHSNYTALGNVTWAT